MLYPDALVIFGAAETEGHASTHQTQAIDTSKGDGEENELSLDGQIEEMNRFKDL